MPDLEEVVDAGASAASRERFASPSSAFPLPRDGSESPSALRMRGLEVTTASERLREIEASRSGTPLRRQGSGMSPSLRRGELSDFAGVGNVPFVEQPRDTPPSSRGAGRDGGTPGPSGGARYGAPASFANVAPSEPPRGDGDEEEVEEVVRGGPGSASSRGGTALWRIARNKVRAVGRDLAAARDRDGDDDTPERMHAASGSRHGPAGVVPGMDAQMDAWLRQTVEQMPVKPDRVTGVRGPLMNVSRVDDSTVDVTMTTSFRAHFSESIAAITGGGAGGTGAGGTRGGGWGARRANAGELPSPRDTRTGGGGGGLALVPGGGVPFAAPRGTFDDGGSIPGADARFAIAEARDAGPGPGSSSSLSVITGAEAALSHAMREWEIRPSDVRLHERLAVGGFAEVFRGTWNGTTVAVKQLLERGPDVVRRMREEAATLARLRHPNLLLFMGWCADPPLIATEFMRRGSLHNILRRHGGPFNAPRTHHAATSVARGMQYLHSRSPPILHLDLKSPNILVDDKWRVKIADFGLARARQSTLLSGRSNFHGTPEWMAPEMLRAESHDEKADVYSFGVVLWELLAAQTPWNDLHPMQVVAVVGYSDRRLTLPPAALAYAQENLVTRVIGDLFWECASKDPRQRPDFDRALARLERAPNALLPAAPPPPPGSSAGTDTPRSDAPSLGPSEHHPGATPRALRQPFGDGRAGTAPPPPPPPLAAAADAAPRVAPPLSPAREGAGEEPSEPVATGVMIEEIVDAREEEEAEDEAAAARGGEAAGRRRANERAPPPRGEYFVE